MAEELDEREQEQRELADAAGAVWSALARETNQRPLEDLQNTLGVLEAALEQTAQGLEMQNARILAARKLIERIDAGPVRELYALFAEIEAAEAFVERVDSSLDHVEVHVSDAERKAGIAAPQDQQHRQQPTQTNANAPQAWLERLAVKPPWARGAQARRRPAAPPAPASALPTKNKVVSALPWAEIPRPRAMLQEALAAAPASAHHQRPASSS